MTTYRTIISIAYCREEGDIGAAVAAETYERQGEFQAQEQLTSFVRDSAVSFWLKLKDETTEEQK